MLKAFPPFLNVSKLTYRAILFGLLIGLLIWQSSYLVQGQADPSDWTTPLNLSQAGTATKPIVVMDANKQLHILWQDMLDDSFVYTANNNGQWSQPAQVELPFGTRLGFPDLDENAPTPLFTPQLVADGNGLIHALWRGQESELVYSRVQAEALADFASWTPRQNLADNVVAMALIAGSNGRLHLTYITTNNIPENPAGLYYRQSADGGATWSEPSQLHQSSYFRLLTPATAHLQMSQEAQYLYVVWDEQPRERVYLIRSLTAGATWGAAKEIDRRQAEDGLDAIGPTDIQITNFNGQMHLTWQAGHEGINCTQYHQWSDDRGDTWQTSQTLLTAFTTCPQTNQFLVTPTNLFLLSRVETGVFLLAWDEGQWLPPRLQPELTTFIDEDVFRPVSYSCGQTAIIEENELFIVGCGVGVGQDVWLSSRQMDSFVADLQVTPIWSTPASLANEAELILSPVLVADTQNQLHLFWQQATQIGQGIIVENNFYYARWDGLNWSRPTAVLVSPRGVSGQLSVDIGPNGNLLAAWSSGSTGEIFFSRVTAEQALIGSAWSEPISLPIPRTAAAAPSLVIEKNGVIRVVYAVTINEDRGIYMVSSQDRGASWSAPQQMFDGVAAGWDMADEPQLTITDEDNWHLLWLRRPLGSNQATLYYAYSEDKGQSWSEPSVVLNHSQQTGNIVWHQIFGYGERTVHRSWQEQVNGRLGLWHQQSQDNGLSWSQPSRVAESTGISSPQMTLDMVGQVYLSAAVQSEQLVNNVESAVLQQWLWQDDHWQESDDSLDLVTLPVLQSHSLAATTTGDGRFAVAYVGQEGDEGSAEILLFTNRPLFLPEVTATPLPTLTPTPTPIPTATPTATPEPTAAIEFPAQAGGGGFSLPFIGTVSGNRIIIVGALLALLPVGIVTTLALILRARSNRS